MGYISKNRHKFYLKCHLIFVCKYRKQLLLSDIRDCVISVFKNDSVPHLSSIGGDLLYPLANKLKDVNEFGYIKFS